MGGGTGTGAPERRIISLGFTRPSELESKIIYVNLSLKHKPFLGNSRILTINADIFSDQQFRYLNSNTHYCSKKEQYSLSEEIGQVRKEVLNWQEDYKRFLNTLIESNNGIADYSRMVYEGMESKNNLDNILDILLKTASSSASRV